MRVLTWISFIIIACALLRFGSTGNLLWFLVPIGVTGLLWVITTKVRMNINGINFDKIDKMTGEEFERFLMSLFKRMGYKVKGTPITNDYGADLILTKENKTVIQAKRYKNNVGIRAVQEVISAREFYKADEAWVVTNNYFTPQARNLAHKTGVKLVDRKDLSKLLKGAGVDTIDTSEQFEIENVTVYCPKCGSPMVMRKGKYGEFWGCSNYPSCRSTLRIEDVSK